MDNTAANPMQGIPHEHLQRVLDYLERDERRDYECRRGTARANHIYRSVEAVRAWVGSAQSDVTTIADGRWKVTVTYLGSAGSSSSLGVPPNVFTVEELEEIAPIIERGIDWRAIDEIVITLNR